MIQPIKQKLNAGEEGAIQGAANVLILANGGVNMLDCYKLSYTLTAFDNQLLANALPTCATLSQANVNAFLRAYNSALAGPACSFCGGVGHEHKECMTLIKWTRKARDCGFGFHFGALKGLAYYQARLQARVGLAQTLAEEVAEIKKTCAKKRANKRPKRQ